MIKTIKRVYSRILLKAFSPVIKRISEASTAQVKPEYLILMERAYKAGYDYHQKMVKKNPELLKWVLKENYMGEE